MKEASGELSMTAITVVAIAAISGIFGVLIVPRIKTSLDRQSKCMNKYSCTDCANGSQKCTVLDDNGDPETDFVCPCDE